MEKKDDMDNFGSISKNEWMEEVEAKPEDVKRAAEIYDLMVQNGNRVLMEITGGKTGEEAVNVLRKDKEAYQKLADYLSDNVTSTVLKHGHELGERIVNAKNSDAILKQHAFGGRGAMDSWDYVVELAAAKLNGTFQYARDYGEVSKEMGQHRHAADFLLADLGNYGELVREESLENQGGFDMAELVERLGLDGVEWDLRQVEDMVYGADTPDVDYRLAISEARGLMARCQQVCEEVEARRVEIRREMDDLDDEYFKARRAEDSASARRLGWQVDGLDEERQGLKAVEQRASDVYNRAGRVAARAEELMWEMQRKGRSTLEALFK
ncbi:MAG: hypothetical protein LBQ02_01990 [Candidatus Nomurabacteria bacterium]|nr:hypothetical protein [Candidatus Nomurabacteria bacterium]